MDIFTIAEHKEGDLTTINFEILHLANRIKEDGKSIAIVLGNNAGGFAKQLLKYADLVWVAEDPILDNYNPELYADVIFQLLKKSKAGIVLFGDTSFGRELAPFIAVKLDAPIQTDVVRVDVTDGVSISKYILQDKVMIDAESKGSDFYVLTIRQNVFKEGNEVEGNMEVHTVKPSIVPRRNFVRYIKPEVGAVDITKEAVLITIGKGIGDVSKMSLAEELAELLGGVVAASRPVIDYGWLPPDRQVGISGKVVNPKLYIGLGVSGASQHVMGMQGSGLIIAINKDSEAPIFQVAEYGIVGDMFEIVPELIQRIRLIKEVVK